MSVTWQQLRVSSDRPLDPVMLEILRHVLQETRRLQLRCIVAGALARVILLEHVYGLRPGRATRDIDFGVVVEDWPSFEALKKGLTHTGRFREHPSAMQRLSFLGGSHESWIDLIPFGGIESDGRMIAWPPEKFIFMNVAGFSEASSAAIEVLVAPDFAIPVASLPALGVLKLITWMDRWQENQGKDAQDFYHLLASYTQAGNESRLYESEEHLIARAGFDPDLAGAGLLAKDAARICRPETAAVIRELLSDETRLDRFTVHIVREAAMSGKKDAFEEVSRYLAFFMGVFNDALSQDTRGIKSSGLKA